MEPWEAKKKIKQQFDDKKLKQKEERARDEARGRIAARRQRKEVRPSKGFDDLEAPPKKKGKKRR